MALLEKTIELKKQPKKYRDLIQDEIKIKCLDEEQTAVYLRACWTAGFVLDAEEVLQNPTL